MDGLETYWQQLMEGLRIAEDQSLGAALWLIVSRILLVIGALYLAFVTVAKLRRRK